MNLEDRKDYIDGLLEAQQYHIIKAEVDKSDRAIKEYREKLLMLTEKDNEEFLKEQIKIEELIGGYAEEKRKELIHILHSNNSKAG